MPPPGAVEARDEVEARPGPGVLKEGIVLLELMGGVLPASHILREWGITPVATYFSEIDEGAIRVAKKEFPEATNLGPVQDIDTPLLDKVLGEHPERTRVLACAGPPCVGVSKLNRFRKGVMDEASNLVLAVKVIFQHLSKRLEHKFIGLMECTDMDPEHRVVYDSVFGAPPFLLCAPHFAPVTRKRLWWTNNEPAWPEGTEGQSP